MPRLPLFFLVLFILFSKTGNAQVRKYFSVGVGLNQSTFYLQPGLFQKGEFDVLFQKPLFIGPELNFQFNVDLDNHNTIAASGNIVVYSRVVAVALPINLSYYYHFLDENNTPFVRLDAGYSFFLTSGAMYGAGFGYKLGKLKGSIAYNNQLKTKSILENNNFKTGRLGSLNIVFEYLFRKNKRGQRKPNRRKRK